MINKSRPVFMGRAEFIVGMVLWAIVGIVVYTTGDMPFMDADQSPGPRFLPLLTASALSLLTVLYWIEAYRNRENAVRFPAWKDMAKPAGFFGLSLLVVLLWDVLGAMPVVMLVSFLEFKFLEKYSWPRSLLVAVLLCAFTYTVFELVLDIALPRGFF